MKKVYLIASLFVSVTTIAQKNNVGIGTTKPDQSAALDISSTDKGFLLPRMTLQQRNEIQNPATGLMVYQSDFISGTYQFDGKEWKNMTGANSVADAFNWGLTGNAGLTAFHQTSNPTGAAIGTNDAVPLIFKVNNFRSGQIDPITGNMSLGYRTFRSTTIGQNNTAVGTDAQSGLSHSGAFNTSIGNYSIENVTTGVGNVGIGYAALRNLTTGDGNVGIGSNALAYVPAGSEFNTSIGHNSGSFAGKRNVFIGANAGGNEGGNDKLYIANSITPTPLIFGDFAAKYLAVGEVAASDRAAATSGGYRLLVKGGMITEKIKVAVAGSSDWADYVFEDDYKKLSLEEVEMFIKQNKHLPNVPSAEEMVKGGLDVAKTDAKLLEKIEELTLYIIEMKKEINILKAEISNKQK